MLVGLTYDRGPVAFLQFQGVADEADAVARGHLGRGHDPGADAQRRKQQQHQ
jgi:hypothetical protein